MLHVGMNIGDKAQLFTEVHRVLQPGAVFGVYDVMRAKVGDLSFPVPWATENSTSHLASPDQYKQALGDAGFTIIAKNSRREFALGFFDQVLAKANDGSDPSPLGLHNLMQETTATKVSNMRKNLIANLIEPVEIIARA